MLPVAAEFRRHREVVLYPVLPHRRLRDPHRRRGGRGVVGVPHAAGARGCKAADLSLCLSHGLRRPDAQGDPAL